MTRRMRSLADIYEGWDGHQTSLVQAIAPLTPEQLIWRPAAKLNSVGELARHISLARITWFARMDAPGSAALIDQIQASSQWGYYQAKGIKGNMVVNKVDMLLAFGRAASQSDQDKISQYKKIRMKSLKMPGRKNVPPPFT